MGHIAFNLYIEAGGYCPAHCHFCTGYKTYYHVDVDKLRRVISELSEKNLLHRISITGAEPFVCQELDDILDACRGYMVSVNTSSVGLDKHAKLKNISVLSDIHVSRHHYDDKVNDSIFKIKTMTARELSRLNLPISLSCNLMKSYIGDAIEIKRYLEFAVSVGARFVGLVGLMNRTPFCNSEQVDYESIELAVSDGFLFETYRTDQENCKCDNYTYYHDGGKLEFYMRKRERQSPYMGAWVFSNNQLTTGFGGKVLL